MSEESTGKTVRFSLDTSQSPQLLRDQEVKLDAMLDQDIDLSDIPSQAGKDGWSRPGLLGGSLGALKRAAMKEKLLLLDDRVVEFFGQNGEQAPEKMNAVLLEYVEAHRKSA